MFWESVVSCIDWDKYVSDIGSRECTDKEKTLIFNAVRRKECEFVAAVPMTAIEDRASQKRPF